MNKDGVSLVIPGRNCARTIRACLDAAMAIHCGEATPLREIIFVDDGSTDDTAAIVSSYPVTMLAASGGGPGAARNVGWRASSCAFVWFIDSDCVAEPDSLAKLVAHMTTAGETGPSRQMEPDLASVGAVGGSYANMCPESLLACLIHEEIVERHRRMSAEVNFLGGFNVLYRRVALEAVVGFDECRFNGPGSPGAEDAELSYRVHAAGYRLRFEPESRVGHFHPTRLGRYLRSQRHHGYWRVALHLSHRDKARGDAYSGVIDHLQPVVAMLVLAALPTLWWPNLRWMAPAALAVLAMMQLPMTLKLVRRTGRPSFLAMVPLGLTRAFWRGFGMLQGLAAYVFRPGRPRQRQAG